jgi:muramoyltetrapeptide carboxypeptidase
MPDRRAVLRQLAMSLPALLVAGSVVRGEPRVLKPRRLRPGSLVGLINPAGATFDRADVDFTRETLEALGLRAVEGEHLLSRYGYLAGRDEERAADVNAMFRDRSVDALLAVRGGWGCSRILPLLDYEAIGGNPKILVGYSDITAILLAVYARTGLVTFHGPDGISTWNDFSVSYFRRVLFEAEAVVMENPTETGGQLAQRDDRVETITGGKASGRLLGGNLSVLAAMVGSPYLPDWKGSILFLEDVGEDIYRVDRMLTQLRLAGILGQISGFVFGKCTGCGPGVGYGSLTLPEVFADHVAPLGIPAWYGAMIGHIKDKFTVPLGVTAEIDADRGVIQLAESAVL